MAIRLAFINGKGGVGKTTGVFHVAGVLSKAGDRVLVLDFDKQRNITDTLLMNSQRPVHTIYDVMTGKAKPEEAIAPALFQSRGNANPKHYGVYCMAGDIRLESEAAVAAIDGADFGAALNEYVRREGITWVLSDMPPSNKAINDLCFAYLVDNLVVPFSTDVYSVKGYSDITAMVQAARNLNPRLKIAGIYLARYMPCGAHNFVREALSKYSTFIDVQIPIANAQISECAMFGRPLSYYKKPDDSAGLRAYIALVDEIRQRVI